MNTKPRKKVHKGSIFDCLNCGMQWTGFKRAINKAYDHASKNNHKVVGQKVAVHSYDCTHSPTN